MTTKPSTVLEALRAMKKRLEDPKLWLQGDFVHIDSPEEDVSEAVLDACPMCLAGMAAYVTVGSPFASDVEANEVRPILAALAMQRSDDFEQHLIQSGYIHMDEFVEVIANFNDDEHTTIVDVRALVDAAIADEQRKVAA